ncbi:MAG: DUF1206 domain-containing protein [Acidimicrobiia bacterium]|nr:DUF1206 domain-containing protein [Acidimicrobiia bacterium]
MRPHRQAARRVQEFLDRHDLGGVGRFGWLAAGLLWGVVGYLALRLALGRSRSDASRIGAMELVADQTAGRFLLALLGGGLALFAAWRVLSALYPGDWDWTALAERAGRVLTGLLYGFFAWTALTMALEDATRQGTALDDATRPLLAGFAGRITVGVVGLGLVAAGASFAVRGWDDGFEDGIDLSGASRGFRRFVRVSGTAGSFGRALVFALAGLFFVGAAIEGSGEPARGLDRILGEVTRTGGGRVVTLLAAIGILAWAVFLVATWRRRTMDPPS